MDQGVILPVSVDSLTVPAIARAAHARRDAAITQSIAVILARVGASTVRVMHQAGSWPSRARGSVQSVEGEETISSLWASATRRCRAHRLAPRVGTDGPRVRARVDAPSRTPRGRHEYSALRKASRGYEEPRRTRSHGYRAIYQGPTFPETSRCGPALDSPDGAPRHRRGCPVKPAKGLGAPQNHLPRRCGALARPDGPRHGGRRVRCERQRGGILVSSASLSTILDTKGTPEVRGKPWKKRVPLRFSPGGEEGGSFDHPGRSPSAQALTPRRARLGACARAAHLP
jgi:hypothetical protein